MRPFEAALKGSREIGFTIVSITFSLIAVFIPVLLMGGMVGRVFREFAVTIAVAIILSGFVSLTLTPMLCARVLQGHHARGREAELRAARLRGDVQALAARLRVVARPGARATSSIMLVVTLATLAGTVWLYIVIPKGFFPIEDTGFIIGITEGPTDISFHGDGRAPAQGRRHHARRSGGRLRQFDGRRRRPESDHQQRPHVHRAQAARRARRDSTAVIQRLRAQRQRRHRHADLISSRSRTSTSAAASPRASTSTRCNRATPRRSIALAPEMRDKIAKLAGPARRHHRPLHQESADDDRGRPREGRGLRRHGRPDPPGAVQRLRHPPGRDDLHAGRTTTRSSWRAKPEFQADPTACERSSSRPASSTVQRRRRRQRHGIPIGQSIPLGGDATRADASARCRSTTRASSRR